ncbi:MAG: Coenzyme F420 hydrogenase/dehydrogenase, beta subunit C-terminal domain [Verrucomicrobiales bacterium]|nr:Coenzyme F420 hydrogenase/dehydrogenase, beta subunit C-terminal domain [Verrucomicrobiales bacterium]
MPDSKTKTIDPISRVISGGYCVGCGGCAVADPTIQISLNQFGQYQANPSEDSAPKAEASKVCPFADGNPNETQLAEALFSNHASFDEHIGYHIATYAGWVSEDTFRTNGSSGGMGSWILCELLEQGLVDRIVHVGPIDRDSDSSPLFGFQISSSAEEVRRNSRSHYYPIEYSQTIRQLLDEKLTFAVVGIPCFIKSLRLLARQMPELHERMVYAVGLVCGHLKSTAFAELLAWQCDITPKQLQSINFRSKIEGQKASDYGVKATGLVDGKTVERAESNRNLYGSNWGLGFFKYKACEFCDDVMAELADITIGDAWLPKYEQDHRGTNLVITRNPDLEAICHHAKQANRIHLERISIDDTIASQDAGFRHRRDGLAYRLHMEKQNGNWHPNKRMEPGFSHLNKRRRRLLSLRYRMSQESHDAFLEAKTASDIKVFINRMHPISNAHGLLCLSGSRAFIVRVKQLAASTLKRLRRSKSQPR